MLTIYKYPVSIEDKQVIKIKGLQKILSVIEQYNLPTLYCLVDTDSEKTKELEVVVKGTGERVDDVDYHRYIGTVSTHSGKLIWHIFIVETKFLKP